MNESREHLLEAKQRIEAKLRFAENEIRAMEAQERGLLRKERNHRIFTRGGMLEAFLLEPLLLSDDQVHELLRTAFLLPEVDSLLHRQIEEARQKLNEEGAR